MKRITLVGLLLALAAAVTVTAVAYPQVWESRHSGGSWKEQWKYTEADYKLALSLKTEGYENLSVGEFDKRVADWTDEAIFHQREEALRRLSYSYGSEQENSQFIHMTLETAFDACSVKHYGGYCTSMRPSYTDGVSRVRTEDVFGDEYPVFEAELDYTITYEVPDETKLTVGEREALLLSYRAAMQKFLDGKTERELLNEKAMQKALEQELSRLDKDLSNGKLKLLGTSLDYFYAYDERSGADAEAG